MGPPVVDDSRIAFQVHNRVAAYHYVWDPEYYVHDWPLRAAKRFRVDSLFREKKALTRLCGDQAMIVIRARGGGGRGAVAASQTRSAVKVSS